MLFPPLQGVPPVVLKGSQFQKLILNQNRQIVIIRQEEEEEKEEETGIVAFLIRI
jgi:hypothetical protein